MCAQDISHWIVLYFSRFLYLLRSAPIARRQFRLYFGAMRFTWARSSRGPVFRRSRNRRNRFAKA